MRTRRIATLALAVTSIAATACSGDGGGGGGGTRIKGFATVTLDRDPDFGDQFAAAAAFFNVALPDGIMDMTDGECRDSVEVEGGSQLPNSAGPTVDMITPTGTLTLDTLFFEGLYAGNGPASMWEMGGTYTLDVAGGPDVDAFSQAFTASGAMTVTSPDPTANAVLDGSDFVVAWTSSGSTDPVYVTIEQEDEDFDTTFEVTCRFDDDGSGTIPAAELAGLSNDPALFTAIQISKERTVLVEDVPGLGGNLLAAGNVSYSLTATVP